MSSKSEKARAAALKRQNARNRKRYATDPEYRARKLANNRKWVAANREKRRRSQYRWVELNPEKYAESRLKYYSKDEVRKASVARALKWQAANPGRVKEIMDRRRKREAALSRKDAGFYAQIRKAERMRYALRRLKSGKTYRQRLATRIPDWAVRGQDVLDRRSRYIYENQTAEMDAYARELAIERKERRRMG